MKIALIASCAVLAGCAITPYQMSHMSQSRVCYLAAAGGPQTSANARAEIQKRGHACTSQDIQIEIARQQSIDAALLGAAAALQQPAPAPARPVNCTTTYSFGVAHTSCR